jgi:hypothetical protein
MPISLAALALAMLSFIRAEPVPCLCSRGEDGIPVCRGLVAQHPPGTRQLSVILNLPAEFSQHLQGACGVR